MSAVSDPLGSSTDLDGDGKTDYFLSYSVDFQVLVSQLAAMGFAGVDQGTMIRLVAGTSTNSNSVNQDWAGINGTANWTQSWSALGGFSEVRAIPEPEAGVLLGIGLAALSWRRRACATAG